MTWETVLKQEYKKPYFIELQKFIESEYETAALNGTEIFPQKENIWNAFKLTPFDDVKVVIIGQDPYHTPGAAHGLCFSVKEGVKTPPSLMNMFKEIQAETGYMRENPQKNGELTSWAKQGVLLLNAILTVQQGKPLSHKERGWEIFTGYVIEQLNKRDNPTVFLLWGRSAKDKSALITNKNHLVLTAAHPSPLSASNGFFGCGHFVKANDFLINNGQVPIKWE